MIRINNYTIKIKSVLGDYCFSEIGRPTGIYWSRDRMVFAIASDFEWLQCPARELSLNNKFSYRVSVYNSETLSLIKVFDNIDYPINYIDFNPDNTILAIATGSFDGGYFFQGELLFWDIKNGRSNSHLCESREVTYCKFNEDGTSLYFSLNPSCINDYPGSSFMDPSFLYITDRFFDKVEIESLSEIEINEEEIKVPFVKQDFQSISKELHFLSNRLNLKYESRGHIWDINMINETEIIAISNNNLIEKWSFTEGGKSSYIEAPKNIRAVEIITLPEKEHCMINAIVHLPESYVGRTSVLYKWEYKSNKLEEVIKKNYNVSLSINKDGLILAREVSGCSKSKENIKDFLIDVDYKISKELNLGYYGKFNHYLRVNGAEDFYFIQGTPASSHEKKWVCRLNPSSEKYSRLFPLEWDTMREAHFISDGGCYCNDPKGEALILASRFDDNNPFEFFSNNSIMTRRRLPNGEVMWNQSFNSQVTSLIWIKDYSLIAFALAEGKIGLVSSFNGELIYLEDVKLNGRDTVIMSLSNYNDKIVAGTIDGRIICYEINP
ncbi:hypothetical protein [Clostridium grantii]|uniref:WD40 repeat n=1 Tax=Clostridium grantii DSM 8605 TaxID=1121316 RepID=A0A1M5R0R0_9CLOT|nr:hypothetical protein [Clostridium grantii]SHH19731.1 hypothetical protein SAMN02745207_00404 [Clostridium grantii DSM 8605]